MLLARRADHLSSSSIIFSWRRSVKPMHCKPGTFTNSRPRNSITRAGPRSLCGAQNIPSSAMMSSSRSTPACVAASETPCIRKSSTKTKIAQSMFLSDALRRNSPAIASVMLQNRRGESAHPKGSDVARTSRPVDGWRSTNKFLCLLAIGTAQKPSRKSRLAKCVSSHMRLRTSHAVGSPKGFDRVARFSPPL